MIGNLFKSILTNLRGGYFGRYLPGGYLVYIHQRTLFGVPFDLNRLEVRGTATPLLEDVAGNTSTAGGQFDFSRNGTFIYLSGKSSTGTWTVSWLDRGGKTQPPVLNFAGQDDGSGDGGAVNAC